MSWDILSNSQTSLWDWFRCTLMVDLFSASAVQIG